MIIPNFRGNLQQRMVKLREILSERSGIRLVGSSFGGLMASVFAMENEERVERMILLAPAIANLMEIEDYRERKISVPVWIYHGRNDAVISLKDIERFATIIFRDLSFNVMDDDHSLHKTFKTIEWDRLLRE